MAVKLIANYAKRLGLPGYSSHQFSVSVETELTDLGQVQGESDRLYGLLQDAVDRDIQQVGFVPGDEYGLIDNHGTAPLALTTHQNGSSGTVRWACSDKQKELILKLVEENDLDRDAIEEIAQDRFHTGVRQLNKLQASGLIGEVIDLVNAKGHNGSSNGSRTGSKARRSTTTKGGR